jgi:hypothetical protein
MRYLKLRCAFCANTYNGINGPWYNPGQSIYNCISTRNQSTNFRSEGLHDYAEFAYNYSSRSDQLIRWVSPYENSLGYHDFIGDAASYGFAMYNGTQGLMGRKFVITGIRYGYNFENINATIIYSSSKYLSGLINPQLGTPNAGSGLKQLDRGIVGYGAFTILEDGFEYDAVRQFATGCERYWDNNEDAWRTTFRYDYNEYGYGFGESILVPAGATLRVSAKLKLATGWSGSNYPQLDVRDAQLALNPNAVSNASYWSTPLSGGVSQANFTAAAASNYEEKQITISPVNFPRHFSVGVTAAGSDNTAEGFWIKNLEMFLDTQYPNAGFTVANAGSDPRINYSIRSAFGQFITRIGGRFK